MTTEEMIEMRNNGATYEQIAKVAGISKQAVYSRFSTYNKRRLGLTKRKWYIDLIPYKGIYEYFCENVSMNISVFCKKVFGVSSGPVVSTMRNFILGNHNTRFSVEQIKAICEVVGKPFEYVFEKRETDER